ncbi:MAG: oligosaccharide flippase family protein [Bacteroidia bacterium]|nr:oligosaccharide flippase family protein [Bacteroidia bacterium]MBT8268027.1 oligosaccharide flippase family protein [Bacteroidia bacterium]NNK70652.1 oligosaccharide flippase family protein [Flavobacteriaceae bacterium]
MSAFKTLFKQTFFYGLATVLPRMLSFLLVPLYTSPGVLPSVSEYGNVSLIFAWFVLFNVILAYGMETAFFRFFNKESDKQKVIGTAAISLIGTSFIFFIVAFLFKDQLASLTNIKVEYISLVLWILLLDALVVIPFAWLRAMERPKTYTLIKIANVAINIGFNIFFLLILPNLSEESSIYQLLYKPGFEVNYIFIANVIASGFTLLFMAPFYIKVKYNFDRTLWRQMLRYAFPVLIAGVAFSVNETFDRILLDRMLDVEDPKHVIGMYSACYKLALFMTLFAAAYRLGIEPYFFKHANTENPQKNYAKILEFFVITGSFILLLVVVSADLIKPIIIRDEPYWEAMWVVPVLLMAYLFLGIYHNLSVWYKITDRTKFGAYISVFGAIVTLSLNIILIPVISYKGSALATLAAYAVMALLSFYFGRKYYPIPYNLKKIGSYLILSIGFSTIYFYLFRQNYAVGIGMLIVFLILVWTQEKAQIKQIIKSR